MTCNPRPATCDLQIRPAVDIKLIDNQSITARSKIFNSGKMCVVLSEINPYQIAYRYLLVVGLSFGRQVGFFSQKAVNCFSLYCVHITVYTCRTLQESFSNRTGIFHGPLSLPSLKPGCLVCFPEWVAFGLSLRCNFLPPKHSCKHENLG